MARALNYCGWGFEGDGLTAEEEMAVLEGYSKRFGGAQFTRKDIPAPQAVELPEARVSVPASLNGFCNAERFDRLTHTYGQSYPDYVRMIDGDYQNAPDFVARPQNEEQIADLLSWASGQNVAVIPYGGGSSVVGGVEPDVGTAFNGAVSLDLTHLNQVVEIDRESRAARIQGGATGPEIESALRGHGLTMRHFPQSFEMATLGGMVATRSGGHFATLYTHIDDFVESTRSLTPAGIMESRRLPGSGAGPSPDRLMIGSEGALGIITEAWMRLQDRPTFRASTAILFNRLEHAAEAIRVISQAGLYPSNVRLLDAAEADLSGFGDGKSTIVVLAFENADHPVDAWMARAMEVCADHGGVPESAEDDGAGHTSGTAGAWRTAFIKMPHFRPPAVSAGIIHDTFETAITWDRFAAFHSAVTEATRQAVEEVTGGPATVSTRFTHVYPDGPAPYYTFVGQGRHEVLAEQWLEIKRRASDALIKAGGTITHHHAVGRDHMKWYETQRPELFRDALGAVKAKLDPAGVLNPGVIIR
ncbi:MAG: FAD-binding oxidoreductase [Pseudomonadota bacterium]